jgi:uncharacterized membrane protein YhhN
MKNKFIENQAIYIILVISLITAILALLHFGFFFKSGTAWSGILILTILYFQQKRKTKDSFFIIAAFLFSIIGDWFLSNMNGNSMQFVWGILFYFLAHLGYLFFALKNGKFKWKFTSALLAIYLVFFVLVLAPRINEQALLWASLIYLVVSCVSLGAAFSMKTNTLTQLFFGFGIFMILFSDTIISIKEFAAINTLNFLILPTYYLAHILITISLLVRNRNSKKQKRTN